MIRRSYRRRAPAADAVSEMFGRDLPHQSARELAKEEVTRGVLWLVGGVMLAGAVGAAVESGGALVLVWIALVYCGYRFTRAFTRWWSLDSLMRESESR